MKRLIRTVAVLLVLAWAGLAGVGTALLDDAIASDGKDQGKSGMKPGAGSEGGKSEATKPGDDKPFDEVVKDGQATVQAPPEHAEPAGHTVPQAPQLFRSVRVSTQAPPQFARFESQAATSPGS